MAETVLAICLILVVVAFAAFAFLCLGHVQTENRALRQIVQDVQSQQQAMWVVVNQLGHGPGRVPPTAWDSVPEEEPERNGVPM